MNRVEKKSFYSFLALYIVSSTLFLLISAYWYYTAEGNALRSNDYYHKQHVADKISRYIINAHMAGEKYCSANVLAMELEDDDEVIAFFDVDNNLTYGSLMKDFVPKGPDYFHIGEYEILISDAPQGHMNIKYIAVQSKALFERLTALKQQVITVIVIAVILISLLAWMLSRFFMRPIHLHIEHIKGFIQDTTHELNTPITALSMSVSRALQKGAYDEKILRNISISTKQLYDIYSSMSFLSFEKQERSDERVDVAEMLRKSIDYYQELSESKKIAVVAEIEPFTYTIEPTKLTMLIGNLINNAIKYSMPNSTIEIRLKEGVLSVKDYGIGIDEEKIPHIFDKYNRETEYAGGFGIGLSIVKKICDAYGISIEVESVKDKGSTFTLRF